MTDCDKTKELMSDYIEDDIESDMKTEVKQHLSICPACKTIFDKTRQLITYMTNLGSITVSSNFDSNLKNGLENIRRKNNHGRGNSFIKGAAVGAAAAGIIFIVLNTDDPINTNKDNFSNSAVGTQLNPTAVVIDSSAIDSLNTNKDVIEHVDQNLKMVTGRK